MGILYTKLSGVNWLRSLFLTDQIIGNFVSLHKTKFSALKTLSLGVCINLITPFTFSDIFSGHRYNSSDNSDHTIRNENIPSRLEDFAPGASIENLCEKLHFWIFLDILVK